MHLKLYKKFNTYFIEFTCNCRRTLHIIKFYLFIMIHKTTNSSYLHVFNSVLCRCTIFWSPLQRLFDTHIYLAHIYTSNVYHIKHIFLLSKYRNLKLYYPKPKLLLHTLKINLICEYIFSVSIKIYQLRRLHLEKFWMIYCDWKRLL